MKFLPYYHKEKKIRKDILYQKICLGIKVKMGLFLPFEGKMGRLGALHGKRFCYYPCSFYGKEEQSIAIFFENFFPSYFLHPWEMIETLIIDH